MQTKTPPPYKPGSEGTPEVLKCVEDDVQRKMARRPERDDIIKRHFALSDLIQEYYQQRYESSDAIPLTMCACKKQIAVQKEVSEALSKKHPGGLPPHHGYLTLAILRDKQGQTEAALNLCLQAKLHGWWGLRPKELQSYIDRLEHKLGKAGKVPAPFPISPVSPEAEGRIVVPCPSCGAVLHVRSKYRGQRGHCKKCGGIVTVPS